MTLLKLLNVKNVVKSVNLTTIVCPYLKLHSNNYNNNNVNALLKNVPILPQYSRCTLTTTTTSHDHDHGEEIINLNYSIIDKYLNKIKYEQDETITLSLPIQQQQPQQNIIRKLHRSNNYSKEHERPPPSSSSSSSSSKKKSMPKLLYIQNPMVWISNKLNFRHLRTWDPQFSEKEFTRGVRQAVSLVTELISQNSFEALKPLLTENALINLRKDVEIYWAQEIRKNIALSQTDIQLIIPRKLHFRRLPGKNLCDIDVVLIALKWLEPTTYNPNPLLVFIDIIVRFHRNYSEANKPDWIISAFKVRRFNYFPHK